MSMSDRFMSYYMDVAERTAQMSHAVRLKVGAVLVINNGIVSTGFNGTPSGEDNCCEHTIDENLVTKPNVIHAEDNALRRAHERNIDVYNTLSYMFVTHAPCLFCASKIINTDIKHVIYRNDFRNMSGIDYLKECDVKVIKF